MSRKIHLPFPDVNRVSLFWPELFEAYTVLAARDEEIVRGPLAAHLTPEDPLVQATLRTWEGRHHIRPAGDGWMLVLTRRLRPPRRERWWLHLALFALTLATTTVAGAYLAGHAPLAPAGADLPVPLRPVWREWLPGLAYAGPLLLILLGHELGHYLVARRRGLDASPPFFIPGPHWINLVGTFGAFIRLRSALVNRAVLLDVGAGGPLVSFFLSLPVLAWGLALSTGVPAGSPAEAPAPYLVLFGDFGIWIGGSIVVNAVAAVFAPSAEVVLLHPLAFAGWIGLFVTVLNLFPLSQLDGGHILFSLIGRPQRLVGVAFLGVLLLLGWLFWPGWWIWAMLILIIGRGRIGHPPVVEPISEVGPLRRAVGWLCIAIFILSFVPAPLALS